MTMTSSRTTHRPYQIVAGDNHDLEDVLRDRQGRVIGLDPYESVTVQAEREGSGTRLTLDGEIINDETVAVDLAGTIDQVGRWALEWELRDGTGQLLRTVPESGTIPLVARRPLTGYDLLVAGDETYTITSGDRELYETGSIEQEGSLVLEQGGYLKITGE